MQIATAYLAAALVFLLADAVMLSQVMKPLFERHLGDHMRDGIRIGPAAVFYLAYLAGLVVVVIAPALRDDWPLGQVALTAAVIGTMAYGTYEFTSYAIMERWHWTMTAVDTTWGAALTAGAAVAGTLVARAVG